MNNEEIYEIPEISDTRLLDIDTDAEWDKLSGIRNADQALTYYTIVKEIPGEDRCNSEFFRLGATSLSAALIKDIKKFK